MNDGILATVNVSLAHARHEAISSQRDEIVRYGKLNPQSSFSIGIIKSMLSVTGTLWALISPEALLYSGLFRPQHKCMLMD